MPENRLKGSRKKPILFQLWPLDWKDLFSAAAGKGIMCSFSGTLIHPSTSRSRYLLTAADIKSTKWTYQTSTKNTEFGYIQPRKLLVNFKAWFRKNDDSQIVQEDRVAMPKSQMK